MIEVAVLPLSTSAGPFPFGGRGIFFVNTAGFDGLFRQAQCPKPLCLFGLGAALLLVFCPGLCTLASLLFSSLETCFSASFGAFNLRHSCAPIDTTNST